jgi:predicted  nucleic acid-binding Zn-ribbon protein
MFERCSGLTLNSPPTFCLAVFMEQLTTLNVDLGDKDSTTRYLASLKSKLADEKAARKEAKDEVQTLARACANLKKTADKFTTQVPELEQKVLDWLTELYAKELSLERTTKVNKNYKSQNARLTKKLESKLSSLLPPMSYIFYLIYIFY